MFPLCFTLCQQGSCSPYSIPLPTLMLCSGSQEVMFFDIDSLSGIYKKNWIVSIGSDLKEIL